MKFANHVSDEVLRKILENEEFDTQHSGVETHLSGCAQCRARLESLADPAWLDSHRDCLANDYERTSNLLLRLDHSELTTARTADEPQKQSS